MPNPYGPIRLEFGAGPSQKRERPRFTLVRTASSSESSAAPRFLPLLPRSTAFT